MPYNVSFISLGCAKNQVNCEQMMATVQHAGHNVVLLPEGADVAVVNTCGFLASACEEAIDNILEMAELKKEGKLKKIIVTGCMAQRYKDDVLHELPEVDAVLGTGSYGEIARAIDEQQICGPSGDPVRIEMFAHGALCMSVSGKCYLSLYETNCSANRGACRQLCRRKYTVTDKETGAQLDIDGRYVLSPKDLCTIDFLDKMIAAGVRVLKIEGRARGAEYVKRVVECYDQALKAMESGTYTPALTAELKERLRTVFNRGFWEGYYAGRPVVEHSPAYGSSATQRKVYVGKVTNFYRKLSVAEVSVEAAPLAVGEPIFFLGATTGVAEQTLTELHGPDGQPAESVAQGELCAIRTPGVVRRGDQLYKFVPAETT